MGFSYAGNLGGAGAPVVQKHLINETCYTGQLLMFQQTSTTGTNIGGSVRICDSAAQAHEDNFMVGGIVGGVVDGSRTYVASSSGVAQYGDRSTYSTTIADTLANGPGEVEVTLIIPGITLVKAPIYLTEWGTALTEQVVTTADSGGVTITAVGDAITECVDDMSVAYCRSGASRGEYRIITGTTSTTVNVATIPFSRGIAVDDVFVLASVVPGIGGLNFAATADCIDGDNAMAYYYDVFYHEINLEESGKEYAVFSLWPGYHVHP
jgi:hypothetical protein